MKPKEGDIVQLENDKYTYVIRMCPCGAAIMSRGPDIFEGNLRLASLGSALANGAKWILV